MSSASSTDPVRTGSDAGLQPWHFFLLLGMVGATWAVIEARDTHPAALVLISAAILAAATVAIALFGALTGFFGASSRRPVPMSAGTRSVLEDEKASVLRAIKELEFDRAMGKIADDDFADIGGRLRARAVDLLAQLERAPVEAPRLSAVPVERPQARTCRACQAENDSDARFCKSCGAQLAS